MRIKTLFLLLALVIGSVALKAQVADHWIQFEETTHDFGTKNQGDPTETVFKFKNVSQSTVRLTNVKASCGCTTPEWSKEDIAPGGRGEIKVSYNSERVGGFQKSISVVYNDRPEAMTLYIQGDVKAKAGMTDASKVAAPPTETGHPVLPSINYQLIRGALAFENVGPNIKVLTSEEEAMVEYRFKNISSLPVKILKEKSESKPEITVVQMDDVLAPGQESMIKLKISGKVMREHGEIEGYFSKNFAFFTDEAEGNKKELTINGHYKRIFTETEKANSPTIEFEATSVEGIKVIEGEKFVYDFVFKNTGHTPLVITSAKASCGCTAIKPITESIAPGDIGAITATFDSKGRVGMQSKSITVTTNDVEHPTIGLRFTVEVIKDPFHAGGGLGQ